MQEWQKEYEQELLENYICKITNEPCRNCSKYGCDHRVKNEQGVSSYKIY